MTPERALVRGWLWLAGGFVMALLACAVNLTGSPMTVVLAILGVTSFAQAVDHWAWRHGYLARQREEATDINSNGGTNG